MKKTLLAFSLVLALGLGFASHAFANLYDTSLNAWWTLDSNNIVNNIVDSSSNANTCRLVNFVSTTTTTAVLGQGLTYASTSLQYMSCGTMGNLGSNLGSGLTISMWVKSTDNTTARYIIGNTNNATGASNGVAIKLNANHSNVFAAGNIRAFFDDNTLGAHALDGAVDANVIPLNKWTDVIVTFNGSTNTLQFYINGVLQTTTYGNQTTPVTWVNWTGSFYVGALHDVGSTLGYMQGSLDDVRIYNRILTAAEVQALYYYGISQHAN